MRLHPWVSLWKRNIFAGLDQRSVKKFFLDSVRPSTSDLDNLTPWKKLLKYQDILVMKKECVQGSVTLERTNNPSGGGGGNLKLWDLFLKRS